MLIQALSLPRILGRARLPLAVLALCLIAAPASAQTRIKDIAEFEGVRENQLVGYGLVVGLNGTGDKLDSAVFTRESLIGMLERLGVNARDSNLDTKNVAAVMVTASLPPFSHQGTRIDVQISALGNAKSLQGGTLLVTPMLGADGEIYAVAQGTIAVSGFSGGGAAETVTRGVPTGGRIPSGAIVEREVEFKLADMSSTRLTLRNADFTTAQRIAAAINERIGAGTAELLDSGTVQLTVPPTYVGQVAALFTDIEQLPVTPDQPARVIINEESGIIVMGDNVRISTVAIAQGNLTISVTETPQVSQPTPFSNTGTTTTVPRTAVSVQDDKASKLALLPSGVTLQELINSLNALGIGPRDMISILQAIKAAGALQADIEVL
jgi:flagellar P-ring protein precursor FlgI